MMNAYANAGHQAAAYKNQQVKNAAPEQLTLMLYSGAARFVAENIKAVEEGRYEALAAVPNSALAQMLGNDSSR